MKKTSAIKTLKILLGFYQGALVIFSLLAFIMFIHAYFSPVVYVPYNWPNMLAFLLVGPTIVFCSCSAIKLLLPARNIFAKWKSLTQISIVFTILWTLLFGYFIFIFQRGIVNHGSPQHPISKPTSLRIGQMAPDFSVKDQFGQTISLSQLKGKVVLLDFWGVWCGPCRERLPHTQRIHENFKDKGLVVIGIHSAFRTEQTADFIAEHNYTFPIGIDTGHIAKDYVVTGWPTYYLIGKEGQLAWGPKHSLPSEKQIESLLKD